MLFKLKAVYFPHFKVTMLLNLWVSLYFLYLFWEKGFDKYPLYNLTLFFKTTAYGIGIAIEKLLSPQREFYYRNMGFGYRKIFGILYLGDLVLFIVMLLAANVCRNFI